MNIDVSNLKWDNESSVDISPEKLVFSVPPHADCFVDPAEGKVSVNAPFYYEEITGDFVIRAKVTHDFTTTFDACALMYMADNTHWGKQAFEFTDFGTHAVVSVVTNGRSDDANGVNIVGKSVWLQLARKGDLFAMHYSEDGVNWRLNRFYYLPTPACVKVGFTAQSPAGEGGAFQFEEFLLASTTLANIRDGK